MKLSIANLLTTLLQSIPEKPVRSHQQDKEEESGRRIPTTIRLEPDVKEFIERYASNMGLSIQDFISMTLSAVMRASEHKQLGELDLMISRFFDLFQAYGVKTADIPLLLPEGTLTRADLEHRDRVLNALNSPVIQGVSSLFRVRQDWLKGASDYCIDTSELYHWYKSPHTFARKLLIHRCDRDTTSVSVMFVTSEETNLARLNEARLREENAPREYVLPVAAIEKKICGVKITTYEVWKGERWNYENCRMDLKVMMYFCERAGISLDGVGLPKEKFEHLSSGKILPATALERPRKNWSIDDVIWDSPTNLEREELPEVRSRYKERMEAYENAYTQYFLVSNLDRVVAGIEAPVLKSIDPI